MGRALWLADELTDAFRGLRGFRVDVVPGWESRGYASLVPVGTMNHHTGRGSYNALLSYMAHNSSIAPLCNYATSRPHDGIVRITVVASGKANHAGKGYLPWIGTDRGNPRTIGGEHQNDGTQQWPPQQVEAIYRANAVILNRLGQPASRAVDHKTYTKRKVDRVHTNVEAFQNVLAAYMAGADMAVIAQMDDTGELVKRIQRDCNQLITWRNLGPERMSIDPTDGHGTKVDGHYGPATARAVREAVAAATPGVEVSGNSFGSTEAYLLTRIGYYADDQRHIATHDHGTGGGTVDTSELATRDQLTKVDGRVSSLAKAYEGHRHAEGTTGPPR